MCESTEPETYIQTFWSEYMFLLVSTITSLARQRKSQTNKNVSFQEVYRVQLLQEESIRNRRNKRTFNIGINQQLCLRMTIHKVLHRKRGKRGNREKEKSRKQQYIANMEPITKDSKREYLIPQKNTPITKDRYNSKRNFARQLTRGTSSFLEKIYL